MRSGTGTGTTTGDYRWHALHGGHRALGVCQAAIQALKTTAAAPRRGRVRAAGREAALAAGTRAVASAGDESMVISRNEVHSVPSGALIPGGGLVVTFLAEAQVLSVLTGAGPLPQVGIALLVDGGVPGPRPCGPGAAGRAGAPCAAGRPARL